MESEDVEMRAADLSGAAKDLARRWKLPLLRRTFASPRRQPDMPDQHTEPEDENDKRRRQLQQPAEDPAD